MTVINPSNICCALLSTLLGSKVSYRGFSAYTESVGSYYAAQEEALRPTCVVSPSTAKDVAVAVASLSASKTCQFAVRSGGHAMNAGAANIQAGVTIDLRGLDSVKLGDTRGGAQPVATVGVGATWDKVFAALEPLGLAVAGGRTAGVGVGGLSTGGGLSWFSPRYGWTCDSVLSYQVALANGSVVAARDDHELLVALRGGSNNLGVVTAVDIQAFEQGAVWGGFLWQPISAIDDVIAELVRFNSATDYDVYASLDTAVVYAPSTGPLIGSQPVYTKPIENPAVYSRLLGLPSVSNTLRITNPTDLSAETASLQGPGSRSNYHEITLVSTVEALTSAWQAFNASVPSISGIRGISWSIVFEPLPPAIYARGAAANSLGLQSRGASPLVVVLLMASWADARDDAAVYAATGALAGNIRAAATRLGAYDPFVYLNYADSSQRPIESYGAESIARLRRVQARVDPRKVFTRQVPGGFKIPG